MPDEVTAAQAAALTGLSERTIRRRILAGQIPARRLSANRFAIRVEDLPHKGGSETIIARLDALDQRLGILEREVLALQSALGQQASAELQPLETPETASLSQLRALLDQLEQETERLAPLLGFPRTTTGSAGPQPRGAPDGNAHRSDQDHSLGRQPRRQSRRQEAR